MNDKPSIMHPLSAEDLRGFDMELGVAGGRFIIKFNRPVRTVVLNKEEASQLAGAINLYLQTRQ